jgi:integrase
MPQTEKKKLNDVRVKSLKAASKGKRPIVWDSGDGSVKGFGVQVNHVGKKTFVFLGRFSTKNATLRTIGVYGDGEGYWSLSRARTEAEKWRAMAKQGLDPAAPKSVANGDPETFADVLDLFVKYHLSKRRTAANVERSLRMDFLAERKGADGKWTVSDDLVTKSRGKWRDRKLTSIDRKEITRLITSVHDDGRPIQANRLLSYVKKLFTFAVDRGLLDASPAAGVKKPTEENKRDRVLDDDEIRAIWNACDGLHAFGRAIRLLLLTGQRRSEVGNMEWSEVDFVNKIWTLPSARTKAGRAHTVPLSDMAIAFIQDAPRLGAHVFTTGWRGNGPIAAWALAKQQIDAAIETDLGHPIPSWHLHDLRRTAASGMAKLGTDRITVSKILNHAEGGVTSIYDQYDRADEKRVALAKWASKITSLVVGLTTPDNVVEFKAG